MERQCHSVWAINRILWRIKETVTSSHHHFVLHHHFLKGSLIPEGNFKEMDKNRLQQNSQSQPDTIAVCCLYTVQPMTRLNKAKVYTLKSSMAASIYKITANTIAMIKSKQEGTGLLGGGGGAGLIKDCHHINQKEKLSEGRGEICRHTADKLV